jgi:tetratricopeptide (TPR) repeat protein
MPVSFFDTLPIELQQRSKAADRQREECEAILKAYEARAGAEQAALDADWIGIGSQLGERAEAARRTVLEQANNAETVTPAIDATALRAEISSQHAQARSVFELRKELGLKHMDPREPHCRVIQPAVITRLTPAELADLVRTRLERLGASVPKHLRPSTRQGERQLHKLVHFCRANELHDKEDYTAAIADYNVSLSLVPDDPYALLNRGNCFKAMRTWTSAKADYAAAIAAAQPVADKRVQQLLAYAHNNLGAVHHELADYVSAFAEYTTALAFDPSCHITWKNRALVYHLTAAPSPDPQQPPPQHKLIFADCLTSMDQDWHETTGFQRGSISFNIEVRRIQTTYLAHIAVDLVRLPFVRK